MTVPLTVDVTGWLIDQLTAVLAARVGSETPGDLQNEVPFLRVVRVGGPNDGMAIDAATMEFHAFATDQQAANELGHQTLRAVHDLRGTKAAGAVLAHARTLSGPSRAAVTDPGLAHAVVLMQTRIKTTR